MMHSLNEVTLLPSATPTDIDSRSKVNPFDENGKLPIFVSPMTCILDKNNFSIFKESKVIPIIPRGVYIWTEGDNNWAAYSLVDFEKSLNIDLNGMNILIDVANGHMKKIYDLVRIAKSKWPKLTVMVGNIAHPSMYLECCKAGVDFVRVGIGGGNGCSTSVQTGVHASLPWLLEGVKEIKKEMISLHYSESKESGDYEPTNLFFTKIIADGGIDTTAKAIKCLALGADYVMMGKTFAMCEEACGKVININGQRQHEYYGMASTKGQVDISGGCTKNPEGIITTVPIMYNLNSYCEKFEAVLRSAMSYTGAHNLEEFKKTVIMIQSIDEFKSFDK